MPGCHNYVEDPEDSVEVCPAWAEHRRVVMEAIGGGDLSRPALVHALLSSDGL